MGRKIGTLLAVGVAQTATMLASAIVLIAVAEGAHWLAMANQVRKDAR